MRPAVTLLCVCVLGCEIKQGSIGSNTVRSIEQKYSEQCNAPAGTLSVRAMLLP